MAPTLNEHLVNMVRNKFGLGKNAFVDAAGASGMPPGGGMPMDPAMMGGGGMPMDPAMMAGMPPGGGGMPMDPAMMGGSSPEMAGSLPPAPAAAPPDAAQAPPSGGAPPSSDAPLTADSVRKIVEEVLAAGGGGGGAKKAPKADPMAAMQQMQTDLHQTKMLIARLMSDMGLKVDPQEMMQPPPSAEPQQPSEGGGEQKSARVVCGHPGRGISGSDVAASVSLRETLTPDSMAKKAEAIHAILVARKAGQP